MFPPNSPLVERTRINNERKLAAQQVQYAPAASSLPGKSLFAAALSRLSFRRPQLQAAERQTTKPCYEQLEA